MCMLCAFPKRYCLVGEDSARSKAESDGATPVYRVPGIKIVIPSQLVRPHGWVGHRQSS